MRFKVNEVFHSIQGEGARIGRPCLFLRLTGCPLRCVYCDTEYAFFDGTMQELDDLLTEVRQRLGPPSHGPNAPFVELTGGEPLAHPQAPELLQALLDLGYEVALETAGSHDLAPVPREVIKIVDRKTPGSGEGHRWLESNLEHMIPGQDELKCGSRCSCTRSSGERRRRASDLLPCPGWRPVLEWSDRVQNDRDVSCWDQRRDRRES